MNITQHGRVSVVVDKEDYEDFERRATRTTQEVRKDATKLMQGIVFHLRKMNKPMRPRDLADFLESRMDLYIRELE